ncbi:maleylpyruvate isomerase N-terminal domain-containing protein [Amycolatopsis sp.]|uniref:maleylpyruvate isomerase N-terminal domain-containing protein n=1 Tax=Amycolatopsis sp. TaxID=37632 RepID=UPI002D801A20|nr:maleylpyruvate isomerase N-terminal domain-containing protein [Amycolatopsis sp.]HET6706366.1 maleylpyruvate isomerase N-terminal domain-containing protein [Amycolatopsis sp.]
MLEAIDVHADALKRAALTAGPAAPVPNCPNWTVHDLVTHIASVHCAAIGLALDRLDAESTLAQPVPTRLRPEFAQGAGELVLPGSAGCGSGPERRDLPGSRPADQRKGECGA